MTSTAEPRNLPKLNVDVDSDQMRAIAAEFVGSTLFLMSSTLAVTASSGDTLMIASAFGLTLIVCIAMTAAVSGGHINPAVTISMLITRNISPVLAAGYIAAQMSGAVFGAFLSYEIAYSLKGAVEISARTTVAGGLLAEVFGTFLLVMTVFATAVQTSVGTQTNEKVSQRAQAPLLIGMSVWAAHLALVGYTGCGINPARWFGTAVVLNVWRQHSWIYVVGPILGAILAALTQLGLFGTVRPSTPDNSVTSPKPHSP
jgi:MIP family channel proteins